MSALTETTSSPTLVGFPSHLTPSATFRPSQCNLNPKMVHRKTQDGDYVEVTDAKYETQTDANGNDQTVAMALVNEGGAYVVEDEVNVGAVAGLVFIGAIMFIVWWKFFKSPPAADEYSVNYASG